MNPFAVLFILLCKGWWLCANYYNLDRRHKVWAGKSRDVIHSLTLFALTNWNEVSSFGLEEEPEISASIYFD